MYAVIFRAKTKELDETYFSMAKRMRELAIAEYGCQDFNEIAISYWKSLLHDTQATHP